MANVTRVHANFHVVESLEQDTLPAAVAIEAGEWVRVDSAGKWALALATTAANGGNGRRAIAAKTVAAGETLTAVYKGLVDFGGTVLDAVAFGDPVYLSDTAGETDTAPGTVNIQVGLVTAGWASGATADKLLRVNG